MRLFRLAQLLTAKYNLQSNAASLEEVVNRIRQDLINAYTLYVNGDKAKEPVLQMLSDAGEPFSKAMIRSMEEIIAEIDSLSAVQLFNRINKMLEAISVMKGGSEIRDFIHNNTRARNEAERNRREHLKSKFEMVVARLSGVLEKQAKILRVLLPKDIPLEGGVVTPTRKELSKEKLLMFMHGLAAKRYGLDNMDTMTRMLAIPELRNKITTLINAIDRGHTPLDGPEVMKHAGEIRRIYDDRAATNEPFIEGGLDAGQEQTRRQDIKNRNDQKFEQIKSMDDDPAFMAEQKRLEDERKQREIDADRERLIRKYEE